MTENWVDSHTHRIIDHSDLMGVLADVRNVFIRSKYHENQLQSSIYGLRLETAIDSNLEKKTSENIKSTITKTHLVEVCSCPDLFVGNSCEVGFFRIYDHNI